MTRTPQPGVPKEVFPCECGQTYSRLEYLRRHQRTHNADKPFKCTMCVKSFARSDVLLRHKRRCHPEEYAAGEGSNDAVMDPDAAAASRRKSQNAGTSKRGIKRSASGSPSTNARDAQRSRQDAGQSGDYHPDAESSRLPYGMTLDGSGGPMDTRSLNFPYGMPGLLSAGLVNGAGGFGSGSPWDLGYNRLNPDHSLGYHVSGTGQYNPASSTSLADYQRLTQGHGAEAVDMGLQGHIVNASGMNPSPHGAMPHLDPRLSMSFDSDRAGYADSSTSHRGSLAILGEDIKGSSLGNVENGNDHRYPGRNGEHSYERSSDARLSALNTMSSAQVVSSRSGPPRSGVGQQDPELSPHGIEHAAALLSMAYGHVSSLRSGSVSLNDGMIDSGLQAAGVSYHAGSEVNAAASRGDVVPETSVGYDDVARRVSVNLVPQPQNNAGNLPGRNVVTYTTLLNPSFNSIGNAAPPGLSMNEKQAVITPSESWDPFSCPLVPGAASPFDMTALWANGMISTEDDINESDPEGWSHLPGSVPAHNNVNAERPLLRISSSDIHQRIGKDLDPTDRFYLPKERILGCYSVPQWRMPSLSTLARVARQTVSQLIVHVPIVHIPTFRLSEVAPAVGFALCMVGSPWHSPIAGDHNMTVKTKDNFSQICMLDQQEWLKGMGVISPDATTCTVEEIEDAPMEERDFEHRKKLIVTEKTAMMHSLIDPSDPQKNKLDEYSIGIIQALLIYATPLLLSPSAEQRAMGYVKLAYIVPMARHLKVFAPNHPHMQVYSAPQPGSSRDAESHWRDWIKQETIRRVIWMLFFYDTLSCLEMGVPPSISFDEVTHVPLPAPDNIWQARSAEDWRFALTTYRAATLEQVMRMHFQLRPGQDTYAAHRESPKDVSALVCHDFGPYGRLVMVISLLRALIQLGQAQVRVEDSTVQIWARSSAIADEQKLNMFELVTRFGVALKRWRQGWDFDNLCFAPASGSSASSDKTSPATSVSVTSSTIYPSQSGTGDSATLPSESPKSIVAEYDELHTRQHGKTLFYEEALPFYWLAQALYNILASDSSALDSEKNDASASSTPPAGSWNKFAGMDFKQMLQSARVFTRMGEGVKMSSGY